MDHRITEHQWTLGPVPDELPGFRVLCAAPGPKTGCWTYLSVGASVIENSSTSRHEFFIVSPMEDLRMVELVTMTAWYHKTIPLSYGHTFPMGGPWVAGSHCDHLLVSTPYPYGPELEVCDVPEGSIRILWLLPITEAERKYKIANDLELLERRFDDVELEYWDTHRKSAV